MPYIRASFGRVPSYVTRVAPPARLASQSLGSFRAAIFIFAPSPTYFALYASFAKSRDKVSGNRSTILIGSRRRYKTRTWIFITRVYVIRRNSNDLRRDLRSHSAYSGSYRISETRLSHSSRLNLQFRKCRMWHEDVNYGENDDYDVWKRSRSFVKCDITSRRDAYLLRHGRSKCRAISGMPI